MHVKDSLVSCWDMNCFEGEFTPSVLSPGLCETDFESEEDPHEQHVLWLHFLNVFKPYACRQMDR